MREGRKDGGRREEDKSRRERNGVIYSSQCVYRYLALYREKGNERGRADGGERKGNKNREKLEEIDKI